jgi:hypothetical protein
LGTFLLEVVRPKNGNFFARKRRHYRSKVVKADTMCIFGLNLPFFRAQRAKKIGFFPPPHRPRPVNTWRDPTESTENVFLDATTIGMVEGNGLCELT